MTKLQDECIAAHPEFPWLEAGNVEQLEAFLEDRHWLRAGEGLYACDEAGEGNMNLTLRLRTDQRTMILKQARPWVEKYAHIGAPWDRILFEQRFYERVASLPKVAAAMPRLMATDVDARVIVMEDVGEGGDFTDLYSGRRITEEELRELAQYLRALHDGTRSRPDSDLANREMRALNHERSFVEPLDPDNLVNLEIHELWLRDEAAKLWDDGAFYAAVQIVGERYLKDGPCLVHGEFFPGSWLRAEDGIKVIDPEFCSYGDAEFDLGVCLAHLRLSEQDFDFAKAFLAAYVGQVGDSRLDMEWVARYAAVEVMRRIIGVGQLSIPPTQGLRARLLKHSRKALMGRSLEELWQ